MRKIVSKTENNLDPVYEANFVIEDPRYPLLVLKINGQTVGGYFLDVDTLSFNKRVCVCSANDTSSCVCGAWDDEQT
jgi:hypothetical protein